MKQEPVAFMNPTGLEYKQPERDFMYNDCLYPKDKNWIPLYTAPKELSDEEIKAIDNSVKYSELALSHDEYMNKFARAILKKASEK